MSTNLGKFLDREVKWLDKSLFRLILIGGTLIICLIVLIMTELDKVAGTPPFETSDSTGTIQMTALTTFLVAICLAELLLAILFFRNWRRCRKSRLGCFCAFVVASIVSGAISAPTSSSGAELMVMKIAPTATSADAVSAQAEQPATSAVTTNSIEIGGKTFEIRISVEGDQGLLSLEQQHLLAGEAIGNVGLNGTYHKNVTLLEMMIAMAIIVAVIAGIIYVTIRIINVIRNIGLRRKKQVDGADDDGGTNSTQSVVSRLGLNGAGEPSEVYAACFYITNPFPATITGNSSNDTVGGFRFVVPNDRQVPTRLSAVVPSGPLIEADDWLTRHGLSTNAVIGAASFSSNGIPVGELSQITYSGGVIGIHIPGMTNLTMRAEWSIDLIEWHRLWRMSVPAGTHLKSSDSRGEPQMHYRLVTE